MKNIYFVLAALLLSATTLISCQYLPFGKDADVQAPTTADVKRGTIEVTVTSSGTITLPSKTTLGFSGAVSGSQAGNAILTELNVAMGSRVTSGQVIARLDTSAQERDLQKYKNNLRTAALNLQKAKEAVYKVEEIAKAEAAVPVARASLESAREAFKKAQQPYTNSDFANAEGAVRNAKMALTNAESDFEATTQLQGLAVQDAMENIIQTGKLAEKSQATDYDVFKASENMNVVKSQANTSIATARNNVAKARDTLATAEFTLNDMLSKKSGDPVEIAQRRAAVVSADSALVNAENSLALMKMSPDALDIQLKEIAVEAAQIAVDDAQEAIDKCTIVAPFDGIIGDFTARVGGAIAPASFSIPLVDPSEVRVDAYAEEYNVMEVQKGMRVAITLDAVQGRTFTGTVAAISPLSTVQSGVVRYAVTINVDITGANMELKDGLSATPSIITNSRNDVLLVPNRALISQGGGKKVQVLNSSGVIEYRAVKIGLSNDQYTEIIEGIQEGEKVVVQAVTVSTSTSTGGPGGPSGMIPGLR